MKNIIEKIWEVDKKITENLDIIFIIGYAIALVSSGILG